MDDALNRFPEDFMFQLQKDEYESLRSHFGTLKRGEHAKYFPYAFTEKGVAMLSSVLNSDRAIESPHLCLFAKHIDFRLN